MPRTAKTNDKKGDRMERSCRRHLIALLIACAVVAELLPQAAHAAPPIEAYGRPPGVELLRSSSSGETMLTAAVNFVQKYDPAQ
jgi:hypothetical protein